MLDLLWVDLPAADIWSNADCSNSKSRKLDWEIPFSAGWESGLTHRYPGWCDGFRNHTESLMCCPSYEDLSGSLVEGLGDLLNLGRVENSRDTGDVVTERAVSRDHDAFVLAWDMSATPKGPRMTDAQYLNNSG